MSQASLLIPPHPQFFDNNGAPLAGGKLYFYQPGTTTPKTVYSSSDASIPLTNPVILDSAGRADVWLSGYYNVVLTDALDNLIWSETNASSQYSITTQFSQWLEQTDILTYITPTQFSVPGNRTDDYQAGRRIKAVVAGGTIYGTISTAVTSGSPVITTVTVVWDSTQLDAGLSQVWLGIITVINSSYPVATFEPPVGTVLPWHKSFANVPQTLPASWHECDGSVISDALSPMNGQTLPNLNGSGYFLRGSATSGTTQANQNKSHAHGMGSATAASHTHTTSGTAADHTHTYSATTGTESAGHTHQAAQNATSAQSGGGVNGLLQNGAGGTPEATGGESAAHTHSVSGTTAGSGALATSGTAAASGALALSGNTAASTAGTPDESRPDNMSMVFIMRLH